MSKALDEIEAFLPEGWAIWPNTADNEWSVGKIDEDYECGGYSVSWLASGLTPEAAIVAARARVEQDEREAADRRADYERRKAAGQLTPLEIAGDLWSDAMAKEVLRMATTESVLARLVNREFEIAQQSEDGEIKIRKMEYKA